MQRRVINLRLSRPRSWRKSQAVWASFWNRPTPLGNSSRKRRNMFKTNFKQTKTSQRVRRRGAGRFSSSRYVGRVSAGEPHHRAATLRTPGNGLSSPWTQVVRRGVLPKGASGQRSPAPRVGHLGQGEPSAGSLCEPLRIPSKKDRSAIHQRRQGMHRRAQAPALEATQGAPRAPWRREFALTIPQGRCCLPWVRSSRGTHGRRRARKQT